MQYPHCDPRILHSPGACEYCDMHSDWQELRKTWNIAFTDEGLIKSDTGKTQCPAVTARPEHHNTWGGNKARPTTHVRSREFDWLD